MKKLDLTGVEHENFVFLRPTDRRINRSIAWLARCKHCGQEQYVGAAQARSGAHKLCIYCQKSNEITPRQPMPEPLNV